MKMRTLQSLIVVCTATGISGCGGGAPDAAPATSGDSTYSVEDDESQLAPSDEEELPDDDATDFSGDDLDSDASNSTLNSVPSVDGPDTDLASTDDASLDAEDENTLSPKEEFERTLSRALQMQDFHLAMQLIEDQLKIAPDDLSLKMNYLVLRVRFDEQLAGDDTSGAADRFIETADLARELDELRPRLPAQYEQFFIGATMNEARAYAFKENLSKATELFVSAVKSGMGDTSWVPEDPFFAKLFENEEFRHTVENIWTEIAQEEVAEFESFSFDFALPNLDAEVVKLSDLKGKLVIVDIWGTWCPPCREEIPHFVRLQETYADDLSIVGINYEDGEPDEVVAKIREFALEQSMNYTCVIGDDETRSQIPEFGGFPTTLFLDRSGKVRLKVVGYHSYEKLEAYVKTLLSETTAS